MSTVLISSILTAKYGESIALTNETVIPHPSDLVALEKYMRIEGNIEANYVYRYESFEIRSANKVYSHILKGTVDVTNSKLLQFETDMDINNSVMSLGAAKGGKVKYNNVVGNMRRRVIIGYSEIDTIEYIRIKEIV